MARKSNGQTPKVITDLVRRLKESGRTRADLARTADISERMVYYLMSGRSKSAGADVLSSLADAVGCEVVLRRVKSVDSSTVKA